jgi:hypothetical protein
MRAWKRWIWMEVRVIRNWLVMKQMKVNEQVRYMNIIYSLYLYMYIGNMFHIHIHVSSIWVRTKSYLWGSNGEQPEVTWPELTSPEVTWPEDFWIGYTI